MAIIQDFQDQKTEEMLSEEALAGQAKGVHQPHDKFFKNAMGHLQIARDFFEHYLPSNIKKMVDLDTLRLEKDTFIDKSLRVSAADMLYSVEIKERKGSRLYTHRI